MPERSDLPAGRGALSLRAEGRRCPRTMSRLLLASAGLLCAVACASGRPSEPASAAVPQRVVVVAPAAAEMLDALGLASRVVAVGDFGPWPGPLNDRPRVGSYDAPNVERVLALEADLVLTSTSEAAAAGHARLRALGVRVVALDTSTYEGVFSALEQVGRLFDREQRAAGLARGMREALQAIEARADGLPPRRVLFVVGRDPLYVAGPGSHIDEMIRRVGGRNVAHDAIAPYQQISLESILERMPEVIVDCSDNRVGAPRGRTPGAWARWEFLPAVRQGRVYQVDPGRLVIPGLRLPEMTRLMGRLVQPEAFGQPELSELGG